MVKPLTSWTPDSGSGDISVGTPNTLTTVSGDTLVTVSNNTLVTTETTETPKSLTAWSE